MSSGHALLSASGSKIWLNCPPAARAQLSYPDTESKYSREGTFGHGLAVARLEIELGRDKDALNTFHRNNAADWLEFYNADLAAAVEGYVERCLALIAKVRSTCPDALVLLEQRLNYSRWVPSGYGTGDLVIVADGVLYVRDLKLGRGVWVDAADNSQMKLYAAGALDTYEVLYEFNEIDVGIDQPRLDNFGSDRISKVALLGWLESYVQPRASLAWNGEGNFAAGEHCTFCRARHDCSTRAEYNLEAVSAYDPDADFKTLAPAMSDSHVAELLPRLDAFIRWAKDLKDWALREQVFGRKEFPALKLVSGRSVRKIVNADGLVEALTGAGVDEALIYDRTLCTLTSLEKLVGKKRFAELSVSVDALTGEKVEFVTKPPGKPKLVPENDPRPTWVPENAADIEFGNIEDD